MKIPASALIVAGWVILERFPIATWIRRVVPASEHQVGAKVSSFKRTHPANPPGPGKHHLQQFSRRAHPLAPPDDRHANAIGRPANADSRLGNAVLQVLKTLQKRHFSRKNVRFGRSCPSPAPEPEILRNPLPPETKGRPAPGPEYPSRSLDKIQPATQNRGERNWNPEGSPG